MVHDKQNGVSSNGHSNIHHHDGHHQDEAEGRLILESISSSQHGHYHSTGNNSSHASLDSMEEPVISQPMEHEQEEEEAPPKQNDLLTFSTLLTRMDREQRRLNQLHQYSNHGQCGQEILASLSSTISSSAMEHHEDIGNESQAEEEHHTKYKSQPTKRILPLKI